MRIPVDYISFIIGRQEDFGLLEHFVLQAKNTEVIAASMRTPLQIAAAHEWADIITVPPSTWEKIFSNPMTLQGERDFLKDWLSISEDERLAYETIAPKAKTA